VFYSYAQLLSYKHLGYHTQDANENPCKFSSRWSVFVLRLLPSLVFSKHYNEKAKCKMSWKSCKRLSSFRHSARWTDGRTDGRSVLVRIFSEHEGSRIQQILSQGASSLYNPEKEDRRKEEQ
jgi:hypothetical protein